MMLWFFKQKTACDMRISDWSADGCSSDLNGGRVGSAEIIHQPREIAIAQLDIVARAVDQVGAHVGHAQLAGLFLCGAGHQLHQPARTGMADRVLRELALDRKSTRLNSSH